MPVLVLQLPSATLAHLTSAKTQRNESLGPHKATRTSLLHGNIMSPQPNKRKLESLSSDDNDKLPLTKKRKDSIVIPKSRTAIDRTIVPCVEDSDASSSKGDTHISFSHPGSALNALGLKLEDPLTRIQTQYIQLGGEITQLGDHVNQLRTQVSQLQRINHHMQVKINSLDTRKEAMSSAIARSEDQINTLNATNDYAMDRIKALELEAKKARDEAKINRQVNSDLMSEKNTLATRNNKLEGDIKKLELDVKKGFEEAKHNRESFEAYRKRVRALGNELWDSTEKDPAK